MMGSIVLDAFVTFTVAFPSDEAVKENQISIAVDEVNPPQVSPGSVSYTHLDVYKRQTQYTVILHKDVVVRPGPYR